MSKVPVQYIKFGKKTKKRALYGGNRPSKTVKTIFFDDVAKIRTHNDAPNPFKTPRTLKQTIEEEVKKLKGGS